MWLWHHISAFDSGWPRLLAWEAVSVRLGLLQPATSDKSLLRSQRLHLEHRMACMISTQRAVANLPTQHQAAATGRHARAWSSTGVCRTACSKCSYKTCKTPLFDTSPTSSRLRDMHAAKHSGTAVVTNTCVRAGCVRPIGTQWDKPPYNNILHLPSTYSLPVALRSKHWWATRECQPFSPVPFIEISQ
jgi:hypothetical protein